MARVPSFRSHDSVHCSRESALAAGPCELAAGPCRRGSTGTVVSESEDVPGSFFGFASSSSEYHGLFSSWLFVVCSAAFRQYFLSVFVDPVSVCLLDLVVALNDFSPDSVDPRLLSFHHHSELPDSGVFPVEVVKRAVVVDSMWGWTLAFPLTRSRPLSLPLSLWWLIIIIFAITHGYWNKLRLMRLRSRKQV